MEVERAASIRTGQAKISGGAQLWGVPGAVFTSQGTTALVANEVRYVPFLVRYPLVITAQQFEVTTGPAGDGNVRVGIYVADTNLQPLGAPLHDSGAIAVASGFTGLKTTSSISVPLGPGKYLVAINCDNAMTIRTVSSGSPTVGTSMGATPLVQRVSVAQTFGAFPTPGTAWTTTSASAGGSQNSVVFQWSE